MNISKTIENRIPSDDIVRYKQRLVAMIEFLDADFVVCLVHREGIWSVVGLDGKLVDKDWQENLPLMTLAKTLEEQNGVILVEHLGEPQGTALSPILTRLVSTISAILDDQTVFVAAKLVRKGVYKQDDVETLARFLEAFHRTGV